MKQIFQFFIIASCLSTATVESQNNALSFDGFDDNVTLNYNANLDFSSNDIFSIEVWFKTNSSLAVIYSNHVDLAPFPGHELAIVNGKAVFQIMNDYISSAIRIETVNNYDDGSWHHMAVVYNGIPSAAAIKLYIDGIQQSVVVSSNNLTSGSTSSGNEPHIGSRDNTTYFFNGLIDEVRIWGRALCGEEIMARKNCQLVGNEPALLGYYNFNQGIAGGSNNSVNTLSDSSPGLNTGTLTTFMLSGSSSNWVSSNNSITGTCPLAAVPYTVPLAVSGKTISCKGAAITLSVTGTANYTWLPGGGQGNQNTSTPTVNTTYTVSGPTPGGCLAKGLHTLTISNCVGINSYDITKQITVFPNPGNGSLFINDLSASAFVDVYNALGAMITKGEFENGKWKVDLRNRESGIYFIVVKTEDSQSTIKYIKE